jgi:hypothetical protein
MLRFHPDFGHHSPYAPAGPHGPETLGVDRGVKQRTWSISGEVSALIRTAVEQRDTGNVPQEYLWATQGGDF